MRGLLFTDENRDTRLKRRRAAAPAWELEASPPAGPESASAAPQLAADPALGVSVGCLADSVFLVALPLVPPRRRRAQARAGSSTSVPMSRNRA
jgi:hypothetical protein